jgi:hypothetical protein
MGERRLAGRSLVVVTLAAILVAMPVGAGMAAPVVVRIDNPSPAADAEFGKAVDGLGDINGDGTGDLAVGAPGADKVYLLSGADPTVTIHTLSYPGGLTGYQFGHAVRGVGDINGDGVEDVAVGAPYLGSGIPPAPPPPIPDLSPESVGGPGEQALRKADTFMAPEYGRAFIFSGATGALLLTIHNPDRWESEDNLGYYSFGYSLAPLGDVNGDEVPDVAVGAPSIRGVGTPRRAWVTAFSGADASELWVTGEGYMELPSFGYALAEIDNLSGLGTLDLLVGAVGHDADPDPLDELYAGRVYVVRGVDAAFIGIHDNPVPMDDGWWGGQLGSVGDQDADTVDDYVVGLRRTAHWPCCISMIFLYSGNTRTQIRAFMSPADETGYGELTFARVDDRDADSVDDFWVGGRNTDAVYLMNGGGHVLVAVSDPAPSTQGDFGWSISATEDLDSDGGLDLLVGKPGDSAGGSQDVGAAFLILGVSPSLPPIPDSDSDGLADLDEVHLYGADPFDTDSDDDLLADGVEVDTYGTSPTSTDTDRDGLSDWEEVRDLDPEEPGIQNPFNPLGEDTTGDNGQDGPDGIPDGRNDWDGDGMSNGHEFAFGCDPIDEASWLALPLFPTVGCVLLVLLLVSTAATKMRRQRA